MLLVHNIIPLQYKKEPSYGELKKRSNNKKKNRKRKKIIKKIKMIVGVKYNKSCQSIRKI